jgi:hypothetical protein
MDKTEFFRNLAEYSQSKGFSLFKANTDDEFEDPKRVSKGQRIAIGMMSGAALGAVGGGLGGTYSETRKEQLVSDLKTLSEYADMTGINLSKGFALLRVAIGADDLSDEVLIGRFARIHERVHDFQKYAMSSVTGKMGTRAEVLVVFSSHKRATAFIEGSAKKCGQFSLRKNVLTQPWIVDLEQQEITRSRVGFRLQPPFGLNPWDNYKATLFRKRE